MNVQSSDYGYEVAASISYLLFTPEGEAPAGGWPLLIFLHGAGERGEDLESLYRHGPPKMIRNGKEIPAVVVAPQCRPGKFWQTRDLIALIDFIVSTQPVNPQKLLITGISMGGFGTWGLISEYPERFLAAAPICGGGELIRVLVSPEGKKAAARQLPIRVIHGDQDTIVPLAESERMVEIFRALGNEKVEFIVYPGVGHDSWTQAYEEDGVIDWLLRHIE